MSSSSSEEEKRCILGLIEIIETNTANEAIETQLNAFKEHMDAESFNDSLESFSLSWKMFLLKLKTIKKRLLSQEEPINAAYLSDLLILLKKSIKFENSSFEFLKFESLAAASELVENLLKISADCISSSAPVSNICTFVFRPRHLGKSLDGFTFNFDQNKLKHNLHDNLIRLIPRNNPEKYAVKMFGSTICVENGLCIEASPGLNSFELVYLDNVRVTVPLTKESMKLIDIEIVAIDDTLSLPIPNRIIHDSEERILFVLTLIYPNGRSKGVEYSISKLDEFIANFIYNYAERVYLVAADNERYEIRASNGKLLRRQGQSTEFNVEIEYYKCLKFVINLLPEIGPLYDSLIADLTEPGALQLNFLRNHLGQLLQLFKLGSFYDPFTALIQSSGFGKTKLCLDLLKQSPGIYFVFRKSSNTGIPQMNDWMVDFAAYVTAADRDDLPLEQDMNTTQADSSTPGRFLLALLYVLELYLNAWNEAHVTTPIGVKAFVAKIGSSFAVEPKSTNTIELLTFEAKNVRSMTFHAVSEKITRVLNEITRLTGTQSYPFLLFLDELDVFNHQRATGRINGLNIVRRALHCLGILTNFFALAIGTNSDALDFTPAVRDNSLRFTSRSNLFPPFILSGNWDIFSSLVRYEDIILNQSSLLNLTMLNVLYSFGRPVWSSCKLSDVMDIAMAKLRNGYSNSNGSRLALLLTRANLSVNVHHVLARTLVRSYMTIVNYVSTDANDMKISYSSEPVLAFAARTLLREKSARVQALQAIKEFLIQRAVDKGRILETIFEHLMLFSIDDASSEDLQFTENPVASEFPSCIQEKLTKCQTFLLKCQLNTESTAAIPADPQGSAIVSRSRAQYYRVLRFEMKLNQMLGENDSIFGVIKAAIDSRIMDALIGTTHFVQLDVARPEDFGDLLSAVDARSTNRNVIDKSLLKVGILRQCGFTLPPNYFGIDFIMPIAMKRSDQGQSPDSDDIFSFVAVQSKSSKPDLAECTFKMSGLFHLNRCPNPDHSNEAMCRDNNCQAYMKMSDIMTILEGQVVILLTASSPPTRSRKTTVCLKGRRTPTKPKKSKKAPLSKALAEMTLEKVNPLVKAVKKPKTDPDTILDDALDSFGSEISAITSGISPDLRSVNYPNYFKVNKIRPDLQPDCIITKNLNQVVTLQKMIWDYSEEKLENLISENLSSRREIEDVNSENVDMDIIIDIEGEGENVIVETSPNPTPKKRISVTCIAVNDVSFFEHLVGNNGIALIKEIINFSLSNFQHVEHVHKPIVQNSMLNGVFSPYYAINPTLQKARGDGQEFSLAADPLQNYANVFNQSSLKSSIDACIVGPIDKTVPLIVDEKYYETVNRQIENYDLNTYKMKLLQEDLNSDDEEYEEDDDEHEEEEQEQEEFDDNGYEYELTRKENRS